MEYIHKYKVKTEEDTFITFSLYRRNDVFFFKIAFSGSDLFHMFVPTYLFREQFENMSKLHPTIGKHVSPDFGDELTLVYNGGDGCNNTTTTTTLVGRSSGEIFSYTVENEFLINIMTDVNYQRTLLIRKDKSDKTIYYKRDASSRKVVREFLTRLRES